MLTFFNHITPLPYIFFLYLCVTIHTIKYAEIYPLPHPHCSKYIHCLILTVLLLTALPSHAVLKERDISSSLSILRQELNAYRHDLDKQQNDLRLQQQMVVKELLTVGNQSQQNALMLYSQKEGNIFDLTYACHAATEQYKQFRDNAAPFRDYITNTNTEVSRYDSLINDLSI